MRKILDKLTFNQRIRNLITYAIYVIFACYTFYLLLHEPSISGKICYALILIVILGIACWAEYLRILYHRMIKYLNIECDPQASIAAQEHLIKKDIFHSYRNTLLIFNTLYYASTNQPEKNIQLLEENEKFFKSSLDCLLVRNYTYFYSYHQLENRSKVKKYYPELTKLKGAKIKGSKVSPLYNWEFIDAVYLADDKDYKKSIKAFENANTINMNQRELSLYHFEFAKACLAANQPAKAQALFEEAKRLGNELFYGRESNIYLESLTRGEEHENEQSNRR